MKDLLRFGGAIFFVFLLLLAALFAITRLYIHSFRKWIRRAQGEFETLRAEIDDVNRLVSVGGEPLGPLEELDGP
jgi:hypothetical protein